MQAEERDKRREGGRGAEGEEERILSRIYNQPSVEPDAMLDPMTVRAGPEPK